RGAQSNMDEMPGALVRQPGGQIRVRRIGVAGRVDHQEGALEGLLEPEKPSQLRVVDVDDRPLLVRQVGLQIGAKVDRNALGERATAAHADPQLFADAAVRAVCGDHILSAYCGEPAAVAVPELRGDSVRVLLHSHDFCREAKLGAELHGALLEQRLERVLRKEHTLTRADIADTGVEIGYELRRQTAGKSLHGHHSAVRHELLGGAVADDALQAHGPEDFHRALGCLRGAWVNGCAAVIFDGEAADAMLRQEQRRGHADQALADDEYGDLDVAHFFQASSGLRNDSISPGLSFSGVAASIASCRATIAERHSPCVMTYS